MNDWPSGNVNLESFLKSIWSWFLIVFRTWNDSRSSPKVTCSYASIVPVIFLKVFPHIILLLTTVYVEHQ